MGENPIWGDDWDDARRLWLLDREVAHCNHGSYGALPAAVFEAQNELRRQMTINPMRWFHRELPRLLTQARADVARFLGADLEGLALVSNVSAGVSAIVSHLPLEEGGAEVLVDGAHAPGMLPLDVPSIGADFWVGNLHKWACAPAGSGALWVAPHWRKQMLSPVVSWGEPDGFPRSFAWVGTADLSAWLATPDSLRVLGSLGWDRVRAHNEALVGWAQSRVAEILGVPPSDLRHDPGLSMALVRLPRGRADTPELAQEIQDHLVTLGVEMAIGCWNGRGAIRLSAQVYNQPSDYERMATGVRDFLAR